MISLLVFYGCVYLKIPSGSVVIVQFSAQRSLNIVEIVYHYLLHLFLSSFLKSVPPVKKILSLVMCYFPCSVGVDRNWGSFDMVWTGTGALLTWCGQELGLF